LAALGVIFGASLSWSVAATASEPGRAYFVTTTRAWELALGGLIAIGAPTLGRFNHRALVNSAGIVGVAGIIYAGTAYSSTTPFPGWAALIPTMSTAALIGAGTASQAAPATRVLGWQPLQQIGTLSYSLYLWHWPLILVARTLQDPLDPRLGLAVVILSAVPAWLTFRLVEQPIRHADRLIRPPSRGLAFGAGCTFVGVGASLFLSASVPEVPRVAGDISSGPITNSSGHLIVPESADVLLPDPLRAADDIPSVYEQGCHQNQDEGEALVCTLTAPGGTMVVLVGDSHAAQWIPAIEQVAREKGWQLLTYTKSACQYADVPMAIVGEATINQSCQDWNFNVTREIVGLRPDLVITTGAFWPRLVQQPGQLMDPSSRARELEGGLERRWSEILQANLRLAVVRDTPYLRVDVPECVVENRKSLLSCSVPLGEAMEGNSPQLAPAARLGIPLGDFTEYLCTTELCPAVIGPFLVWRDTHHITATYARQGLSGPVRSWLEELLEE
ncbi:MAG TPA: acyltransferase family protein, partial [Acidimicrobiia bacterium]|nr:acyltransferase family protein [Acidimicrobiia bacterium]